MTMKASPKRNPQPAKRRRRRSHGVPATLVAVLVVIALFFGGLVGFVAAKKSGTGSEELTKAQNRITELENILTMMGFTEGFTAPEEFTFEDSDFAGEPAEFGESAEFVEDDNNEVLWNNDSLISGMLEPTEESVIVAEFNGGTLMSDEIIEPYNDQLATEAFGFGGAGGDTLQIVMENLVADKICYAKAQELGVTELTEADHAAIRESMEAYFNEQKAAYKYSVNITGMTPEEADAAVTKYVEEEIGLHLADLIAEETEGYWRVKLFDAVTKDVTVSEEEIQAAYDAYVADQSVRFVEYPEDYEFALMSGETITYNLEGYRRVKHIMLPFTDPAIAVQVEDLYEQIGSLSPESAELPALQQQLDALYTDLDKQAEAIVAELEAGADFEALIEKYGQDEGMKYEPVKSQGYFVASGSTTQFSADFIEACMVLDQIGEVSVPAHSIGGVHIIKYVGDVTPGAVSLDDLRETISEEVLAESREQFYIEQEAQWLADADIKYYPENLQ